MKVVVTGVAGFIGSHLTESLLKDAVLKLVGEVTGRPVSVVREESQRGDMRDTLADTSAARRDLGVRSTATLREGLAREWARIRG